MLFAFINRLIISPVGGPEPFIQPCAQPTDITDHQAIRVSVQDSSRLTLNQAFHWSISWTVSHVVSRMTIGLSANGYDK
jgi:hypothetical protein